VQATASILRLLVPVVNPETAKRQLELAFVLHDTTVPGSIHALTVVSEQDDTEEAVVHGEHLMGYCLTQAAATDIPIQPSVRVDANPSDGIVRAVKELHANLVLCGWSSSRALGRRVFGTVMGNLLDSCGSRLLFCRLVRPLATNRRLLILWPPLTERRSDLIPLLREARQLARQIGVTIRVHLAGGEPPELRRHLANGPDAQPLTVLPSPSLGAAQARLFEEVGGDDLILLLCERRSASLWTPSLDRLPERVSSHFPENNLLVAYPALVPEWDQPDLPEIESQDFQGLSLCAVELEGTGTLDGALHRMTESAFPGNPELAEETRHLLAGAAQSFPVPLGAGAVLLHGHSEALQQPYLIVGLGKTGWELPGLPEPAGLLLALLSPKNLPPEHHLGWLKHLAGVFYDPALAQRIEGANSAVEICAVIREQKRNDPESGG
jgi:nucleotide-binding universal stress UspA family protein/mannitol/fructose-specific phosphotransferase system IIA component (Ntr-type)